MSITVEQMNQLKEAAELGLLRKQRKPSGNRMRFSLTGKLSMKRADIVTLIRAVEGIWDEHPHSYTDYIIVGNTGQHGRTQKLREAEARGTRIISEDDFVAMLMPVPVPEDS